MIVRITMLDGNSKPFQMLFGDSYKKWDVQYQEYLWLTIKWWDEKTCTKRKVFGVTKAEASKAKWKAWGGLKWCRHDDFQHELNREGCQDSDPDNPNPRNYADMIFEEDKKVLRKAVAMYRERIRHLGEWEKAREGER